MTGELTTIILRQLVISTLLLVAFVESVKDNTTFFPRLPVGKYQVSIKRIENCDPPEKYKIQVNWYLKKMSPTKTEIEGNMTLEIPLDDTLIIFLHFDQKTANGGWTNDVIKFRKNKGCSTIMEYVNEEYSPAFGWPSHLNRTKCPFPPMVYYTKGLPTYNWEKILKMPNFFIYGTFRLRFRALNKDNKLVACIRFICDIKRPWELP